MSLIVKNFFENVNIGGNATKISEEISQRLLHSGLQPGSNVPLAAYLLYKVAQNNSNSDVTIQDIFEGRLDISEGTRYFAKEQLPEEASENRGRDHLLSAGGGLRPDTGFSERSCSVRYERNGDPVSKQT